MNLTDVAKQVVNENAVQVDDLSKAFEVPQAGLDYLQQKIEALNKKAARWGVPGLTLKIISEREEDIKKPGIWGGLPDIVGKKKFYTVSIDGDVPHVEGYTFVAKIQHTTGGENILNVAPRSPVKNLPEIYQTVKGECDVCKEKRERFNTFILQLDKDNDERFPDKKKGDLIQVGSACLVRFFPGVGVQTLINYAKIIEELRQAKVMQWPDDDFDGTDQGYSGPNPWKRHVPTETLMRYICLVYTVRGKYVSRTKAGYGDYATGDEAVEVMFDTKDQTHVHNKVKENQILLNQAKELATKVIDWMKKTDFHAMTTDPEWKNFYHNLDVVAHASTIDIKNVGYLAAVLATYNREENKKAQLQTASKKSYVGKIGERVTFNGKLTYTKSFPSQWGRGLVTLYRFEDLDGNIIQWWSSSNLNLQVGQTYPVTGLVKSHEVDKYNKQPTTVIKNGKFEKM